MAEQSQLLALPRELRNNIYAFIVMGEGKVRGKGATTTDVCPFAVCSPLILSCTQIHDEYCENLLGNIFGTESNTKIEIVVSALNFTPALDFMRKLQPAQLAHIKARNLLEVLLVSWPNGTIGIDEWSGYCKDEAVTVLYTIDEDLSSAGKERSGHCEPLLRVHHSEELGLWGLWPMLTSARRMWQLNKMGEIFLENVRLSRLDSLREAFSQHRLSESEPVSAAAKSASAIRRERSKRPARRRSQRPTLMVVVGGVRRWREVVQPE
ncbi:hypothetical protein LTR10_000276 [Elasticomyces elasticus]|nr:hypothetical protein LTR10_000276 [Elasticomyces elasticus]KAK4980467.1 hypothetical protein LTR42_000774 [Elasticomyces elasticus]